MAEQCKVLGEIIVQLLEAFQTKKETKQIQNSAKMKLEEVASLADDINNSLLGENAENLVDMLEDELLQMDKAIEEAANRIQVFTIIYFTMIEKF